MNKKIINIESVTFGIPNVICLKYILTHSLNVILFATIIVEDNLSFWVPCPQNNYRSLVRSSTTEWTFY